MRLEGRSSPSSSRVAKRTRTFGGEISPCQAQDQAQEAGVIGVTWALATDAVLQECRGLGDHAQLGTGSPLPAPERFLIRPRQARLTGLPCPSRGRLQRRVERMYGLVVAAVVHEPAQVGNYVVWAPERIAVLVAAELPDTPAPQTPSDHLCRRMRLRPGSLAAGSLHRYSFYQRGR